MKDYKREYEQLEIEHQRLLTVLYTSIREYNRLAAQYQAGGDDMLAARYRAMAEGCSSVLRNMGLEVE
jgi:predicted component of type VI protein secretion system